MCPHGLDKKMASFGKKAMYLPTDKSLDGED